MPSHLARRMGSALIIVAALASFPVFAQTTLVEQGRAAISRGDSAAATTILEKAVAQSPNDAKAHFYLGSAYGAEAQKAGMFGATSYASKAKEELEKAVALDPKYVDARFGLVQYYAAVPALMGGSYDEAFEQAKEIKAIDPVAGHRAYAFIYTQQKKPDLAKQEYLDAIRESPKSADAHSYYGAFLVSADKNYTVAFAEYEAALKLDPNHMLSFYRLGRAAALANANLPRGEEVLKKYLAHTPKENEPTLASAHYYLGLIYEHQGKKAEAKQNYEEALKLNPSLNDASEALKRVM